MTWFEDLTGIASETPDTVHANITCEVVADTQALHLDKANAGAIFQVASQFNLLEMIGPNATPRDGVGIYEYDQTQGPVCAIACGAGTIYRNYFARLNDSVGQTNGEQVDQHR